MKPVCDPLVEFLNISPTMFHACENVSSSLLEAGFIRLFEGDLWELHPGGKYYVVRGDSSLIAFRLPGVEPKGFMMAAAHSDSPTFRLRQNAEMPSPGGTIRLSVEKYGGAVMRSWLDRPLSLAGRVFYKEGEGIRTALIDIDRDLLVIPSLAPHLQKSPAAPVELKLNVDMFPLYAQTTENGTFNALVAKYTGISTEALISTDLFLYPRQKATVLGLNGEFLASPRIDDLECAWCCLQGLLEAEESSSVAVCCLFNNEEVGSGTWQGAGSTFLEDTITRLCASLGMDEQGRLAALANSFMVSADNAHAVHPAHADYYDPSEQPKLNGGVVIKYNAAQKYTTDGLSSAIFTCICNLAGVPVQRYSNRADLPGGSTLGHVSLAHVSVPTLDIGLAQLAMHSSYEVAGADDPQYLMSAMKEYFSRSLRVQHERFSIL